MSETATTGRVQNSQIEGQASKIYQSCPLLLSTLLAWDPAGLSMGAPTVAEGLLASHLPDANSARIPGGHSGKPCARTYARRALTKAPVMAKAGLCRIGGRTVGAG
jgi:hypothetical protein